MARTLESGYLYRIRGNAWIIKPVVERAALSMYDYEEHPVFLFNGRASELNPVLKNLKKDTASSRVPLARRVA